jgi:cytochrome c oxidase assembly protein subunit 15
MIVNPGILTWTIRLAVALAFTVVVLGAYVRLSHAGLGCPDWPGCYGEMIVPDQVAPDVESQHQRPLEQGKAWKEMIHRYAAGTLGLLIAVLAIISWKNRKQPGQPLLLPGLLVALVVFQAALGMWTVTLLLRPVIVVAHLLGGMTILSLLFWMLLERSGDNTHARSPALFPWVVAALAMLALQISLGGWTSANYAALACPDFPVCQGQWWPPMDFAGGFTLWHKPGMDYEGGILAGNARAAIHMAHRLGALFSFLIIGTTALCALLDGNKPAGRLGLLLLGALLVQLLLGISNVLLRLPLPVAVAHNAVAALLLLTLVALLHRTISPGIYRGAA